ncbi:alpha/beta hydrolase [Candidatus Saccharibacteria bacterium]|nr:alpha/beta hydrolase [Candidatus Saccharibacteria bacterium]
MEAKKAKGLWPIAVKVILQNLSIEYVETGEGRVLLFLHGWGDSLQSFDLLANDLSKKYHIVRLDLPGFGKSELPLNAWFVEDYAEFVSAFCKKLSIEPYGIVGHSLGGRIAIKLCSLRLLHPKKLILLASAGIRESGSARNRLYAGVSKVGKAALSIPGLRRYQKTAKNKLYKQVGNSDYLQSGELKQTFMNIINEDLQSDASKIHEPTLLIYGKDDIETPVKTGEQLKKAIPDSSLEIIPNGGHFIHQEQTTLVAGLIEGFLN